MEKNRKKNVYISITEKNESLKIYIHIYAHLYT